MDNLDESKLELEVRFYLTTDQINRLIHNLSHIPKTISNTIDFYQFDQPSQSSSQPGTDTCIGNDTRIGSKRTTLHYINNNYEKADSKTYMYKNTIKYDKYDESGKSYKISLAEENDVAPFNMTNVKCVRLKRRTSYIYNNWSIDITYIKQYPNINNIKQIRNEFFNNKSSVVTNTLSETIPGMYDKIEVEAELIDNTYGHDKLTLFDKKIIHKIVEDELYTLIYVCIKEEICTLLHKRVCDFASLLPKAKELTIDDWIPYRSKLSTMFMRDKISGVRYLVYIKINLINKKCNIYTMNESECKLLTDTKYNHSSADLLSDSVCHYLFDTEYYDGVYYVLHPLVWKNIKLYLCSESIRTKYMKYLRKLNGKIYITLKMCKCNAWHHKTALDDIGEDITEIWEDKDNITNDYKIDGFIFTTNDSYFEQHSIKWKPSYESTIDFLAIRYTHQISIDNKVNINGVSIVLPNQISDIQIDQSQDNRYLLFVGKHKSDNKYSKYVPVLFDADAKSHIYTHTDDTDLHGHIIELLWLVNTNKWILKNIRNDKKSILHGGSAIGNNYKTAYDIWSKYHNPFKLQYLWIDPME